MRLRLTLAALACLWAGAAIAQPASVASIVATCGTPNVTYSAGDTKPITMDTSGNLCGSSTGTTTATIAGVTASSATQINSTITLGATFQTALAASSTRKSCLLQNTSTHLMYVYVGVLGSATTANSFQVPAGGSFACGSELAVVSNAINITTSTTADTYVIASQ